MAGRLRAGQRIGKQKLDAEEKEWKEKRRSGAFPAHGEKHNDKSMWSWETVELSFEPRLPLLLQLIDLTDTEGLQQRLGDE